MIELNLIADAIRDGRVRITDHAEEKALDDKVSIGEVLSSIPGGEIIEQYPGDRPYPSCLVYSDSDGPLHSVWSYNGTNSWAALVTVYRPDPKRWINWRRRRAKS